MSHYESVRVEHKGNKRDESRWVTNVTVWVDDKGKRWAQPHTWLGHVVEECDSPSKEMKIVTLPPSYLSFPWKLPNVHMAHPWCWLQCLHPNGPLDRLCCKNCCVALLLMLGDVLNNFGGNVQSCCTSDILNGDSPERNVRVCRSDNTCCCWSRGVFGSHSCPCW